MRYSNFLIIQLCLERNFPFNRIKNKNNVKKGLNFQESLTQKSAVKYSSQQTQLGLKLFQVYMYVDLKYIFNESRVALSFHN